MAHFSNAELAQQINDLIAFWSVFNTEYANWLGGTVAGGPGSDGNYPLTDYTGAESLVACPAKLADNVSGYVGLASASETAAAASAAAAATSESNAATSAATATAQAVLADADRIAAELAETGAVDAKVTAIAQAAAALVSATNAATSETNAATSETNAAASAAAALASEIAAATFNPVNYLAVAGDTMDGELNLAVAGTIMLDADATTGRASIWTKTIGAVSKKILTRGSSIDKLNFGDAAFQLDLKYSSLLLNGSAVTPANWDTAYGWGDHASGGYMANNISDSLVATNYASGNLDLLVNAADQGVGRWGGTQPTTGSPGFNYGVVLTLRDLNQNLQLAFGNSGSNTQKLKVRRADSGVYQPWTEFVSTISPTLVSATVTTSLTLTAANIINTGHQDITLGNAGAAGLRFKNSVGTTQGYVYHNNAGVFGLLNSAGGWALQIAAGSTTVSMMGNLNVANGIDVTGNVIATSSIWGSAYGTAAAPTFSGNSVDPDTGMYNESSNVLAFTTGGVRRLQLYNAIANFSVPISSTGDISGATFNGFGLSAGSGGSPPGANAVVKTHTNGYTYLGWINTVSGASVTTPTRIYASQDAFLRYYTPANFRNLLALPSLNDTTPDADGYLYLWRNHATAPQLYVRQAGAGPVARFFVSATAGATTATTKELTIDQNCYFSTKQAQNRFITPSGYIELGPKNASWAHIYTDRAAFYFNKDIRINNKILMNHASTSYASADVTFSTSAPTGGLSGDIWYEYT